MSYNKLTVTDIENYLNNAFILEAKIKANEVKIALIEFELAIEKLLDKAFIQHAGGK